MTVLQITGIPPRPKQFDGVAAAAANISRAATVATAAAAESSSICRDRGHLQSKKGRPPSVPSQPQPQPLTLSVRRNVGETLIFLAPEGDELSPQNATPFWVGDVDVDSVSADESTIPRIRWRACFKYGYAQSIVSGAWKHICVGHTEGRGGVLRFHEYSSRCRVGSHDKEGHGPYISSVSRNSVVLYGAKLTPKSQALTATTKRELWKLRMKLHANGGIPSEWGDL